MGNTEIITGVTLAQMPTRIITGAVILCIIIAIGFAFNRGGKQ